MLYLCWGNKGNLKVTEIFNFTQDDLMTEEMLILDCHSDLYVWVGQHLDPKIRQQALSIAVTFIEKDFLMENLSRELPLYIIMEGCEPPFFTRFFNWDYAKSAMHGNSFQRNLAVVKNGAKPSEPKRRTPTSHAGRSTVPDKSQRSSRSMSFSPEPVRVRGRSPAFNELAAIFQNPNSRNLSTPPPAQRKPSPKPVPLDSAKAPAISSLSASFERPKEMIIPNSIIPKSLKVSLENNKPKLEVNPKGSIAPVSSQIETPTKESKEGEAEDEEGLPIFPYERLKTTSAH